MPSLCTPPSQQYLKKSDSRSTFLKDRRLSESGISISLLHSGSPFEFIEERFFDERPQMMLSETLNSFKTFALFYSICNSIWCST